MNTSDNIDAIAAALAKAQAEMTNPVFNKTNPHFKSNYADLASVLNAVRPALAKNGIAIMQMSGMEEAGVVLYTRLTHTSGQWIQSVYPVTISQKHQDIAAAMTYAKRISLSAMAGVAGEDDDDGNAANNAPVNTVRAAKQTPKPVAQGYSDEESARITHDLIAELKTVDNKTDLQKWGTSYSDNIKKLTPPDQATIRAEFVAAQKRLNEAAAEKEAAA
jgi:hypothetical protein